MKTKALMEVLDRFETRWYNSKPTKYIGIGIFAWGIGTGIGAVLSGLNKYSINVSYEMDVNTKYIEEKKLEILDKNLIDLPLIAKKPILESLINSQSKVPLELISARYIKIQTQ